MFDAHYIELMLVWFFFQYKHAVYVQTCKLFADLERLRQAKNAQEMHERSVNRICSSVVISVFVFLLMCCLASMLSLSYTLYLIVSYMNKLCQWSPHYFNLLVVWHSSLIHCACGIFASQAILLCHLYILFFIVL